jgi:hypothetical protein
MIKIGDRLIRNNTPYIQYMVSVPNIPKIIRIISVLSMIKGDNVNGFMITDFNNTTVAATIEYIECYYSLDQRKLEKIELYKNEM